MNSTRIKRIISLSLLLALTLIMTQSLALELTTRDEAFSEMRDELVMQSNQSARNSAAQTQEQAGSAGTRNRGDAGKTDRYIVTYKENRKER